MSEKKDLNKLGKSELYKKQSAALDKRRIELNIPHFNMKERVVGLNPTVVFGLVLIGSLLFNWQLYKGVKSLGDQVSELKKAQADQKEKGYLSVEVNHRGSDSRGDRDYIDAKVLEIKGKLKEELRKELNGNYSLGQGVARSGESSLVPSASELIDQVDIQQYTVSEPEQYSNFRSLLRNLSRMKSKYRSRIQSIVTAYSHSHEISGVDRLEYENLMAQKEDAFEHLGHLHERVKEEWKMKNRVSQRY